MESADELQHNTPAPVKRPELLTWLCILSFIGSGLAAVSNLFIFLSYEEMITLTDEINLDLPEFEMMMSGGRKFFLTGTVFYSISLIGAIYMWKLRKIGFHFYTGAQVFILALPVAFIPAYPFSVLSVLVSAAFIVGYAVHLKLMK
jgi:FtsH-binding integral membrane protein